MSNVEEPDTIPKAEPSDLESFSESSPEPDDPQFIQEAAQVQKRKGGRKPVCLGQITLEIGPNIVWTRYMQRLRRESRGIVRLRQLFANEGPSISNN